MARRRAQYVLVCEDTGSRSAPIIHGPPSVGLASR